MAARILPLPVALVLGLLASAASAGPVSLTEVQMDRVTAGADVTNEPGHFRYEADDTVVEMRGHEGRAAYEVVETEAGSALHVVAPSDGTEMVVPLSGGGTPTTLSLPSVTTRIPTMLHPQ